MTKEELEGSWIAKNSNILDGFWEDAVDLEELKFEIQSIVNRYEGGITAYNKKFDFPFLESRGFVFGNKLDCPMIIATNVLKLKNKNGWKGWKWPKVQEALDFYFPEEKFVESHRAGEDSLFEAMIVWKLYEAGHFKI